MVVVWEKTNPTGWWFQPIWKILVKLEIFPKVRGENEKYLSCHHLVMSQTCLFVREIFKMTTKYVSCQQKQPPPPVDFHKLTTATNLHVRPSTSIGRSCGTWPRSIHPNTLATKKRSFFSKTAFLTYFLGSMYGIFTYKLVAFLGVNVGKYTIHGSWILWVRVYTSHNCFFGWVWLEVVVFLVDFEWWIFRTSPKILFGGGVGELISITLLRFFKSWDLFWTKKMSSEKEHNKNQQQRKSGIRHSTVVWRQRRLFFCFPWGLKKNRRFSEGNPLNLANLFGGEWITIWNIYIYIIYKQGIYTYIHYRNH